MYICMLGLFGTENLGENDMNPNSWTACYQNRFPTIPIPHRFDVPALQTTYTVRRGVAAARFALSTVSCRATRQQCYIYIYAAWLLPLALHAAFASIAATYIFFNLYIYLLLYFSHTVQNSQFALNLASCRNGKDS